MLLLHHTLVYRLPTLRSGWLPAARLRFAGFTVARCSGLLRSRFVLIVAVVTLLFTVTVLTMPFRLHVPAYSYYHTVDV